MTDPSETYDVVVVGAGLSGIGVARRLSRERPALRYVVVEARAATGGTWDLFRYPGVRADSDMVTLGYADRPWREPVVLAPAAEILRYVRDASAEGGVDEHVRLNHRVTAISWSGRDACWSVDVERTDTGRRLQLTSRWVFAAAGYFRYDTGYLPRFDGLERFAGTVVHPQRWPEDLDITDRRVVVIGSGATAITLVPALAERAALVTMVQRTPTYVLPAPAEDRLVGRFERVLGPERGYAAARRIKVGSQAALWRFCRRHPRTARRLIRRVTAARLPAGFDVDTHFNPPYDPWDQRMCVAADGDFFAAIREGSVQLVTDSVVSFTERGVLLASGCELDADVVVTATGLVMQPFGGFPIVVHDTPVALPEHVVYKGFMLDGVPNFGFAMGYTNASWTLKVDLVADHLARLIGYLRDHGDDGCVPIRPDGLALRPLLDLGAGYVRRAEDALPRQGDVDPWRMTTRYRDDVATLRDAPVLDDSLRLLRAPSRARQEAS